MRASIDERETGPRNQVLYGARYQNLVTMRDALDARRKVHRHAGYIVSVPFDFAGMKARTNLEPKPPYIVSERNCTADCSRWSVERGEQSIARDLDESAVKALDVSFRQPGV